VLYGTDANPLTANDKRMGLAMATIAGVHLWATQTTDWNSTVVPGGQHSIPEMGESPAFPRGWLGQPSSDPQRLGLGHWKRTFTGGLVYANVTNTAWVVDGRMVPTMDAVFVRT
jgi:hypothetical protein